MALHFFNQDVSPTEYLGWIADETIDPATIHPNVVSLLVIQGPPLPDGIDPSTVTHQGSGVIQYQTIPAADVVAKTEFVIKARSRAMIGLVSALLEVAIPVIDGHANLTPTQQAIVDRLKTDFGTWGGVAQASDLDQAQIDEALAAAVEANIPAQNTAQITGTILP